MGLIRAAAGAVGGTFADQWKDFLTVPPNILPTSAMFPAIVQGRNAGRGSNTSSSSAIITQGSKIIVPEGYGLLTFQDGEITSAVTDAGAYIWDSEDSNSRSIFAGDGIFASTVSQSWQRFKFGGRPSSQQIALFVSLKEIPNNRFGTQSAIYWDDAFLNTQAGAIAHGTYTIKIIDPILFVKNFVPAVYLQNPSMFDFGDPGNAAASQVFTEVVSSLAAAFSDYTNSDARSNRIARIQQDAIGFAASLARVVEQSYQWESQRGMTIPRVAIAAIEYDETTKEILKSVQRADALGGARGNSNIQASVAAGLESAGESQGSAGIIGLGIAAGGVGLTDLQQPAQAPAAQRGAAANERADAGGLITRLGELKTALDAGLITEDEYAAAKSKILGI